MRRYIDEKGIPYSINSISGERPAIDQSGAEYWTPTDHPLEPDYENLSVIQHLLESDK